MARPIGPLAPREQGGRSYDVDLTLDLPEGWRITSAPEPSAAHIHGTGLMLPCPACNGDPVSAQAAPDPWAEAHKRSWTEDDCNAAVRAALEGLRAEVLAWEGEACIEADPEDPICFIHSELLFDGRCEDYPEGKMRTLAIIDARLAALDG